MIKVKSKVVLKLIEKFFYEKSMELLNGKTIDTNRLKLNNPLSTVRELVEVCNDLAAGRLKNDDYAKSLSLECIKVLDRKHYLKGTTISIDYFIKLLKKIKKDDYLKIVHAGNIIVEENKSYVSTLFSEIKKKLVEDSEKTSLDFEEMRVFSRLVEYLYVEINYLGYSKFYLNRFVSAIFSGIEDKTFDERFQILESLSQREDEIFEVIFGLDTTKFDKTKVRFFSNELEVVGKAIKGRISNSTKGGANEFFENHKNHILLIIKVETKDYYQALNDARKRFLKILDVLYLGHSDRNLSLINECFIVGSKQPEKSSTLPTMYQIDGYYRSSSKVYKELLTKISNLNKADIPLETLTKINSGIRYLRMGGRSGELINKFVNYWIGLEYIFSTYDASTYTVGRLREYFKRCHASIYIKRNVLDFHRDIKRLRQHVKVPNYDDNLEYLSDIATYDYIIENSDSPLLIFRAEYYKLLLNNPNKVRGALENHQKNLEWNLTRIYRIRNEIVHNAAIKEDIAVLTSHLRYYLTFIINSLIEFFINYPQDVNKDDKINIDDYFLLQDLKLSSLENSDIEFKDLIAINNPMELII